MERDDETIAPKAGLGHGVPRRLASVHASGDRFEHQRAHQREQIVNETRSREAEREIREALARGG